MLILLKTTKKGSSKRHKWRVASSAGSVPEERQERSETLTAPVNTINCRSVCVCVCLRVGCAFTEVFTLGK